MQEQDEILPEQEVNEIHDLENLEIDLKPDSIVGADNTLKRYSNQEFSHWSQFGLLLGMIGVGIIAASLVSILVVKLMMSHVSVFNLEKEILNPANATAMKVMQLASTIMMFLLPAFLFALLVHKKPFSFLGYSKTVSFSQLGLVFVIAIMAMIAGGLLSDLNEWIPISKHLQESFRKAEENYNDQVMAMAKMSNFKEYLLALLIIAFTPAIVEETFFRGTMQQFFISWFRNPWIAIIVTSIIFSAIHFSYYGFLPRASLGVVLGLLFYYSKNLWLNILAHFLNNAIDITYLYVLSTHGKSPKEAMDDHFPILYGLIGVILLVLLIIRFKKVSEIVLRDNENKLLGFVN